MSNSEYRINVKALVDVGATTANDSNTNTSVTEAKETSGIGDKVTNKLAGLSGLRYGSQQISKVTNLFGNDETKKLGQTATKLAMYSMKGKRALSGNPLDIIDLAIDVICDIGQQVKDVKQKQAAVLNEQDLARIEAGLFNIEDTRVKVDSFSGRYQYRRRK